jgi:amino acid adenylation domain-containing protein
MSQSLHQLFEELMLQWPYQPAIEYQQDSLTYKELNHRANQLAFEIDQKAPASAIIGISTTRSINMVVGILAILKSGKAYLPLNPTYPNARLLELKENAQLEHLLCDQSEDLFFENLGLVPISYQSVNNQAINNHSFPFFEERAYVLYTSGSTGKPKGVCLGHKALINLIQWQSTNSNAGIGTRTLQFAPLTFDASFEDIFSTFITGGTIVLIDEQWLIEPEKLLRFIDQQKINRIFLPFVALQFLTDTAIAQNIYPQSLQYVMTAGEQLKITPQLVSFFSKLPNAILYNQYGPTETHVCTCLRLDGNPHEWPSLPSIGKALPNTQIHIVDENAKEVVSGEIGELWVSGICLANGYLNNTSMTNEKFIDWIDADGQSCRVYKTGDLAKYLTDGNIEFLGRKDDQVKISGHRIEPAELELVLTQQPGVSQAVVLAQEGKNAVKRLVAYLMADSEQVNQETIRTSLKKILPVYMIPAVFVFLNEFPKTSSGKVDRKMLPQPDRSRPALANLFKAPQTAIEQKIAGLWSNLLQWDNIGVNDNFFELGGSSLLAISTIVQLKNEHSITLTITALYQFPTIAGLAKWLDQKQEPMAAVDLFDHHLPDYQKEAIAIIAMSGRFPGANNLEDYWDILKEGRETIRFFKQEELDDFIPDEIKLEPDYVPVRGVLEHAADFDANFFQIQPKQAELTDPQQRLFLELAWEVLEKSGYLPSNYSGRVGVFGGTGNNTYYQENILPNKILVKQAGAFQVMTYNEKDYVATRAAFVLNLNGPAVSVHTACSTSLLAIAQAVESIRNGQCEIAIAGGVSITSPINSGHLYQEGGIYSKDGHTRTFDNQATGTVFSDGAGMVLLKPMSAALRDGDTIYALIKGAGINNDGGGKGGFTAPSSTGQSRAIQLAMQQAGVHPEQISYVEAHGTATPLGDPIELEGLSQAYASVKTKQGIAIGSVKSNIGHLTAASGVAGLIKTALALYHQQLPASINCSQPNTFFDFANSPFYVNTSLKDWSQPAQRFAGVSSFGVGGTNVHVVLASYQNEKQIPAISKPWQLVGLTAKSPESLNAFSVKLFDWLEKNNSIQLADLSFNLIAKRTTFNHRRFYLAKDCAHLLHQLQTENTFKQQQVLVQRDQLAFIFPGQGAQFPNMGKELYETEPIFKVAVDQCAHILANHMDQDIRKILYPIGEDPIVLERIHLTEFAQPAIFVIEYAFAKLCQSWGFQPNYFLGHSIGEYVAAHLAGIFSLEDALMLIAQRGRLMSGVPSGSMLAVKTDKETIEQHLPKDCSLAVINGPQSMVVAGPLESIHDLSANLRQLEIANSILKTSHAFHSAMMEPMLEAFQSILETVPFHPPTIPIISTLTGELAPANLICQPQYWVQQISSTVVFSDAVKYLLNSGIVLAMEIGPGQVTSKLYMQQLQGKDCFCSGGLAAQNGKSEREVVLQNIGQLWIHGYEPNWNSVFDAQQRIHLDLPTYAFDRKRYWLDPIKTKSIVAAIDQPIPSTIELSKTTNSVELVSERDSLMQQLKELLEQASGLELATANESLSLLELGFDSLLLTQVAINLKKGFGIPISFRQLNEDFDSLNTLATYISQQKLNEPIPTTVAVTTDKLSFTGLTEEEQAELKKPFGASAVIEKQKSVQLTELQEQFLQQLIESYTSKTGKSKNYTGQFRDCMADPRVVSGFKPLTKEIVYPIVVNKSKGARLWDLDGNEYIDALNGFGSNLLGYQPAFITKALKDQIDAGYEVGPQHQLAGEVCQLIGQFTGFERTALCNTGSEAVLGAMRIARTVTGRSLIVAFAGSYHGIIDEVIVRGASNGKTFPAAAGIMPEAVQNMLILEYGTEESLRIIEARGAELAAVLVEPVQSRRPEFQPVGFLKVLRKITDSNCTALIFDEVITGFRMHPAGAQGLFGIQADLGTYGKVIAGGLPIGVISGKKEWMDALDGGTWQYGDASVPQAGVTYFAGTFVRHPLALATSKASLEFMLKEGHSLQQSLTEKTNFLAEALNQICRTKQIPLYVAHFGSLWKLKYKEPIAFSELLFTIMRQNGIHIWDGFPCFITLAHTDEDINSIIAIFNLAINRMMEVGFFVPNNQVPELDMEASKWEYPPFAGAVLGRDEEGNPVWLSPEQQIQNPYNGPLIDAVFPVTESQKEIWLSCFIGGEDANRAYNESVSLRLEGVLQIDRIQEALFELVKRHEALRSAFCADGKQMLIFKELEPVLKFQDLSRLSKKRQEDVISEFARIDVRKSFDLLNGPLFRFALFDLGKDACYVTLTVHHIIGDGWSLGVLLQDFGRIYSALASKGFYVLNTAVGFKEFAAKQLAFQNTQEYLKTETYWLEKFKDDIPAINLQTDFARPPVRSFNSQRNDYELPQHLVTSLKKMGAAAGCSFVTSLLAAFEVFLQKTNKQDQIIIGLPSAGQPAMGMLELVGHCVNLLPIRSKYEPDLNFIDYLKTRKSQILDDLDHQQLTFGSLIRKLPISRYASLVPMVPVVFNIDLGMDKGVHFDSLKQELVYHPRAFENFELFLNANGNDEKLILEWSYNTRLFKSTTIAKMMADFEQMLLNIVSNPDEKLLEIGIGQKLDFKAQLLKRNPVPTAFPRDKTLAHLFQERVSANPDSIAFEQNGVPLSFQLLNENANQLAGYLSGLGVKENDLVAVAMDRSEKMVIALLAIHKLGAAYLPIDANYPMGRIRFMLDDASVKCLLVSNTFKQQFIDEQHIILVDSIWKLLVTYSKENPPLITRPSSLAYVIYTSGSTGNPKGVGVEQHSLVNLFTGLMKEPGINIGDRFLAITTIAFDISAMELFLPLIAGATLVLADNNTSKDGRLLLELLQSANINIMFATPATWLIILEAGWETPLPIVALTGGEALPGDLSDKLLIRTKALWNMYGPTETTILSTQKQIKEINELITIGKPVNNTSVYILDDAGSLVQDGKIGEIYIAGEGLARGYWNNSILTNERFVHNPYTTSSASQMYKTGDLGMYLESGEIMYMGRSDNQVKIRGLRIELGEIEFHLRKLKGVKEAIIISRDGLLVAYIVPDLLEKGSQMELQWKQDLKYVLPGYMIPNEILVIKQMPLTPNGKVDRNALPILIKKQSGKYWAPRSSMEQIIAKIWSNILSKQKVGIRDDFFELGGHSNLAVLAMIRLEKETGIRLPIAAIFQSPTVEELAKLALNQGNGQLLGVADNASIVPLKPFGNKPPLMIVHGFNMSVLMFMSIARQLDHMQPVYGIQPKGLHKLESPLLTMEEIASEYIQEMLEKVPSDSYAIAGYSFGGFVAFEMAKQLRALGKKVTMLAMFDCNAETGYFRETSIQKLVRKSYRQFPKIKFILKSLIRDPKETIAYQGFFLKSKWESIFGSSQLAGETDKEEALLDIRYEYALMHYHLNLSAHDIDLFRVKKRLYFVPDQEFLGWRENTMRDVFVHEVPGDHKTFLISPNHIEFAKVLQSVLKRRQ